MTAAFISTKSQLEELLKRLEGCTRVAIDTESNSFFRFHERLCLLQLTLEADGELVDFIVDPLGEADVRVLAPFFVDRRVLKVFHDPGYDLTLIRRDVGPVAGPLFDTMLAMRLLGEKEFGLAAILKKRFSIQADKRYQRADWTRRPLSEGQLEYAARDTHFLLPMVDMLRGELEEKGRWAWFVEECERTINKPETKDKSQEDRFFALKGLRRLNDAQLAIAWALFKLRDERAKVLDRAVFRVLHNDAILEIAETRPRDRRALSEISGVGPSFVQTMGERVLQAIAQPETLELPKKPPPTHPQDRNQKKRFELWRERRKAVAEKLGLDPEVVLSNATLWAFAAEESPNVAAHPDFSGWRKDVVLNEIQQSVKGLE